MEMPETIGGYTILSEIGSGGFGTVYRARDPLSGQDVALKTLTEITDDNDLERFRREARLAYEMGHPNIIRILHYGEDGGSSFIVMELMPISLREILGAGRLSLSMSLDICRQAAHGLKAAHERNVIHRDVKPDNILLDAKGAVKITDFGLARAVDLTTLTATGDRIGTPLYMSPEQWKGERADARSDIYSLGVMLYEMLTGEAPFVIAGKTPVKQIRHSIPSGLDRIVEKCTELDPRRRYQTMDELIQSIRVELVNRCALIDFYEATGGPGWKRNDNWLTDKPLSEWHGVNGRGVYKETLRAVVNLLATLKNFDQTVSHLILANNNLEGEIPSEIAHLTEMESFDLSYNYLSGSIPPELGSLTEMERLDLGVNRLSGNIPTGLSNLIKLKRLDLSVNRLSGNIPPEMGNLTELIHLGIGDNRLSGSMPSELGNLTKLKYLGISNNRLSGSMPPEMGNLIELEWLQLDKNRLSGNIPPELGNLARLERLELAFNCLSGNMPSELGSLAELERLILAVNHLSGNIPPEISSLTKLEYAYISRNGWTGCIPRALFNIPQNDLDKIDLPDCDE